MKIKPLLFALFMATISAAAQAEELMPVVPFQPTPNITPLRPADLTPRQAPTTETEKKPPTEIKRREGFIPLDRKKLITRPINKNSPAIIRPGKLGYTPVRRKNSERNHPVNDSDNVSTDAKVLDVFTPQESGQ